jgi:hypothetical protein
MIAIDWVRYIDETSVKDHLKIEDGTQPFSWLVDHFARYLLDDNGRAVEFEAAKEIILSLSLANFRELRSFGRLTDVVIPFPTETH